MLDTIVSMLNCFIFVTAHIMVGYFSSPLKYSKLITKIIWGIWFVIQTFMYYVIEETIIPYPGGLIVGFIAAFAGQYLIYFLTTKGKFSNRLFKILTYSVFFCIYSSLNIAIIGSFSNLHWSLTLLIRILILGGIVWFFLDKLCPLMSGVSERLDRGWYAMILADVVFLLTVIFSSIFPNRIESVSNPFFLAFVMLSVAIISVYPIIFICIKNMSELEREKRRGVHSEFLVSQFEAQAREIDLLRRAKHDTRHHYGMLLSYAQKGELDRVMQYLQTQTEALDTMTNLKFCENDVINNIISIYYAKSQQKNIQFTVKANAKKTINIAALDLVAILSNVLENAVHGCEEVKAKDALIHISIHHKNGKLVMCCENTCKASLEFEDMPTDMYGTGVYSICTTAEKYNGNCRFCAHSGVFTTLVVMDE